MAAVLGRVLRGDADVAMAGEELLSRLDSRALVVTRGSRGMSVFESTGHGRNIPPARQGEVADVTGAGDTVASALVLALAAGCDVLSAAVLANAAASVVVGRRGAATAAPEEVARALEA
jgi:bifunctional ADP-heptose synthase (sugar kinase/adenylyltransferase)